jgi:YVTN family beta-propeller protein
MALDGDTLYVADTENHLIRRVDLKSRTLETVAGTGKQSQEYFKQGPARTIALSSPWDLQIVGRQLYITMAGPHQIWKMDLDKNEVSTFAGSGREARKDGTLLESAFAQPSGIASDGKRLYVADSESNIIRAIDPTNSQVETLVGGDLFEFGDTDGSGDDVRLQHPLGVVAFGDKILIADTYNHKIKQLDPAKRTVSTFLGRGKPGQVDGTSPSFYEPGGLSVANDKLYVADTNNHAVRVVDLKTKTTSTLNIKGLEPPAVDLKMATDEGGPNAEEIKVAPQRVRTNNKGSMIIVNIELPAGYHLNPAAPQRYRASVESGQTQLGFVPRGAPGLVSRPQYVQQTSKGLKLPLTIPFETHESGPSELRVQFTAFYCREDNTGTCQIKTLVWRVPVEVSNDASVPNEIKVQGKLTAE